MLLLMIACLLLLFVLIELIATRRHSSGAKVERFRIDYITKYS